MTKNLLRNIEHPHAPRPKEGDLYKQVEVFDKSFRLFYGYYEDFERECPFNDPIPIYPDFIKEPQYTAEGIPLATAMQSVCEFYNGKNDEDSTCADCSFFKKHKELFGLCSCPQKRRKN